MIASETMVRMGELAVSTGPGDVLTSIGLGSCIGLVLLDRAKGVVGLAHVMLPERPASVAPQPGKFADSAVPALGASGAIAGVIGCYARMFPAARIVVIVSILIIPLFFEVSALAFAMIWFAMQVIPGLISLGDTASGGIAWWAHIGGFVAGWLATPLLRRPAGAHRRYYRDEGIYGFLPDGRRQGGGSPWI